MDTPETPKPASRFFWKLDLNKFVNIWYREKRAKSEVEPQIEISEFKQLNVLAYLLHEIRPSDNTLAATYQEIADKTGVSKDTVVRIMHRLGEVDFIRKVRNGLYIITPEFLVTGRDDKSLRLWHKYCQAERIGRKPRQAPQRISDMNQESYEPGKE